MAETLKEKIINRAAAVDDALTSILSVPLDDPALIRLQEASRHGALGGGKRLRPFLVIEGAILTGASMEAAMPAACAIEMVHSYSLVHDDLPAMDDADLRRGQPSVHKAYDEAIAVLVGDALLTDAFTVLTDGAYAPETATTLVQVLSRAAGSAGMVGGQMMDLYPVGLDEDEIIGIQRRKTGALIVAAAEMGGIVGGADPAARQALKDYAAAIGLAFQIVDDILDVTQDAATLGKPAGADEAAGKATFVSLLGLEGARARVADLTVAAKTALAPFGDRAEVLAALAEDLSARTA
ncbi:farnesyl diphosphate synthase [Parvularcula sp. LCG005]|uniref:polyprenyl synthetase family protein n=1 Tax=Parvularcula sp. LCG005 TaxID=3078805 RepID=UPI002943532A|nr:farnesyl diphosphate synthase [Parvularcula sp. LCG005]WOI52041.1 polyprenyl synthetase family protein [Parvularcula sp. LCG005]